MNSVSPFDLQCVKEKMKKAVGSEYEKDPGGLRSQQGQRPGKQQAEKKTCLDHAIKTKVIRVERSGEEEYFQDNPWEIRDYAASDNPSDIDSATE
jgi:hypothetical protein